jgi:hypothetical protein
VHDIERYGIGKSELATWRNAKYATLLFMPRGEVVTLTLLADDLLIGRHTIGAGQFGEALAAYGQFWHAGTGPNEQQHSFVTAFGIAGQGVDVPIGPHPGPKGFPGENLLVHTLARTFVAIANASGG